MDAIASTRVLSPGHGSVQRLVGVSVGAPDTWSQDALFSRAIAARVVPRAALHSTALAKAMCKLVGPVHGNATLADVLESLPGPPEAQNVVLETAVATARSCPAGTRVEEVMLQSLQDGEAALMPHLRRSVAFMLAASREKSILEFLVDAAVLDEVDGVDAGLRDADRVTLFQRIARSSIQGFRAAAGRVQWYAEAVEEWEWEDTMREVSPWAVMGLEGSLPQWLPLAEMDDSQQRALVLQKQSDTAAARIVCGST